MHDEDLWRCEGIAQQLIAELTVQAERERIVGFAAADAVPEPAAMEANEGDHMDTDIYSLPELT